MTEPQHIHDFTGRKVSSSTIQLRGQSRERFNPVSVCACGLSEPMARYLGQHPESERGTVETDMGRVTR